MCVDLKLLDNLKFSSRLSTNFACEYSEDDRIAIVSDSGVYIVALKGYLTNPFPTLSCKNNFLTVSNYTPSMNVDMDINSFHKDLERIDLYEVTMSTEYSSNINHIQPVSAAPLCIQWSPRGVVGKTDCLLAVLTNLYSLEIYVKYIDENEIVEYCMIMNLVESIINIKKSNWKYSDRLPTNVKLNEMKRRVKSISCTSFTWSHLYKIENKEYVTILVGHMNGNITVWRIEGRPSNSKEQSKPYFLGEYSTQLENIVQMHWHYTKDYGGGLSFADCDGKMSILHVKDLNKDTASLDSELAFWTQPDKVVVDKIAVMCSNDYTYIILIKQMFLIIYGLDETGKVFDNHLCCVGSYYITGIHHFNNEILILTLPGILKHYSLSVVNQKIHLEEKVLPIKDNIKAYRTHGFFCSKNMVLFGVVAYPSQLRSLGKTKTQFNVFVFHNSVINPLNVLWYNKSGSLRDYWDCFEVLRLLCLKEKRFPWLGLPSYLNHDTLSLTQLKILRCLAKISEMVFDVVPLIRSYDIKPYIILHYLVQIKLIVRRMNVLLAMRDSGKELSKFQMHSLEVQNFFLKEMVVKNVLPRANVGKNFVEEIKHVMSIANELRYPPMVQCIWCGEKIIGPTCLPPHADSRCSISMMPISLGPAYKCSFCKTLAHREIEKEEDVIFCTYCDIPMEKLYSDEANNEVANEDFEVRCDDVKSVCFDDCSKDDISFSDIEDNESEYIIFSDSDDESSKETDKLKSLYVRLKDMSLEDTVKMDSEETDCSDPLEGPSRKVLKV